MRHATNSPAALRRHRAQCQICRRPDCEEIDRQFLDWITPREIAETFQLGSSRTVYRHAHALGLFDARRSTLRFALDRLIEHVGQVTPTAAVVLGAIRLAYQIDQKQHARAEGNGRPKTLPFRLSLDGLPRTNAVSGRLPETDPAVPSAAESEPSPSSPPTPAPSLSGNAGKPPSATPAREKKMKRNKQTAVSGFVRPWSKRKKPFP
jgi:hypothetical protein